MRVGNLHLPCLAITPSKADTPLVVDADTVSPSSVSSQRLETIAGRRTQIIQPTGCVEHQELRPRPGLELTRQTANGMACEDGRGGLVRKAPDHSLT